MLQKMIVYTVSWRRVQVFLLAFVLSLASIGPKVPHEIKRTVPYISNKVRADLNNAVHYLKIQCLKFNIIVLILDN